jgi:tetratricopeptide (TPR) repeat protein
VYQNAILKVVHSKLKSVKIFYKRLLLIFACSFLCNSGFTQVSSIQHSNNKTANADFLKALDYINRGTPQKGGSPDTLLVAVHLLQKAIEEDPRFVAAYMELYKTYWLFNFSMPDYYKYFGSGTEILPKAKNAILKVLEIDSTSAEAYSQLATMNMGYEYKWDEALSNFLKAMHYDPANGGYVARYAQLLALKGNWIEAEKWINKANSISPKDRSVLLWSGWFYHWKRDYEKANYYLNQMSNTGLSRNFFLGLNYLAQGKNTEAVTILRTLYPDFEKADGGSKAALAYALLKNGEAEEGRRLLQRSYELNQVVKYRVAAFYAGEKKYRKTIRLLNQAYKDRGTWMLWLKYDPVWDPMRNMRAFKKLIRKMNFE